MNLMYEKDVEVIVDVMQELRHIVEDEGYETNVNQFLKLTDGFKKNGIEELNFCINKRCQREEFESEELEEFLDRMKDLLIDYKLRFGKSHIIGFYGIYMNIFITKKDSIKSRKLNEANDMGYISEKDASIIIDVLQELRYILEDDGIETNIDSIIKQQTDRYFKYSPINSISCKIWKRLEYGVPIDVTNGDEFLEFFDRLKNSLPQYKISYAKYGPIYIDIRKDRFYYSNESKNNIGIQFSKKNRLPYIKESISIDELECSYPPIPFEKYDLHEILEKVEELRYIIEDEGYYTNFDRLKYLEISDVHADVSLYISRPHPSRLVNVDNFFSEELFEFLDRLIGDLPDFYFGSYGNTLRGDNFKEYIRSNIKSNGYGSLYFTFYIYKRKKSNLTESIDHLKERGVSKNTRFIYDEMSGDTYFFLYNLSGQLTGYQKYNPSYPKTGQGRLHDPKKAKYFISSGDEGSGKKIAAWGLETLKIEDKYLFITEGIFDCVKIHNAGYPGIAVLCNDPSGSMRNWLNSLPQKKIVIYDNDQAGRHLKSVGNYSFFVPGDNKDLGDLKQEEATKFIKGCIDKIESKKINEELVDKEELKIILGKNYKIVLDEIFSIKYLVEDFGAKVVVRSIGVLEINPANGMVNSKERLDEYGPLYEEFIERCQDICKQNGFTFISDFGSGSISRKWDGGGKKWINWKFFIRPNRKLLFNK